GAPRALLRRHEHLGRRPPPPRRPPPRPPPLLPGRITLPLPAKRGGGRGEGFRRARGAAPLPPLPLLDRRRPRWQPARDARGDGVYAPRPPRGRPPPPPPHPRPPPPPPLRLRPPDGGPAGAPRLHRGRPAGGDA